MSGRPNRMSGGVPSGSGASTASAQAQAASLAAGVQSTKDALLSKYGVGAKKSQVEMFESGDASQDGSGQEWGRRGRTSCNRKTDSI
jgi:hypothetical protein